MRKKNTRQKNRDLILTILMIYMLFLSLGVRIVVGIISNKPKADKRFEQMLEVLENDDKDALKTMFSKKAVNRAYDFDGGIDYVFDFFQGDVESWESSGLGFESTADYSIFRSKYTVITNNGTYLFFTLDYSENILNLNKDSLYTLCVIKETDNNKQFEEDWEDMKIAGIYRP